MQVYKINLTSSLRPQKAKEVMKATTPLDMKLIVFPSWNFVMLSQGSKWAAVIIVVAGLHVTSNLSEPAELTMMPLDIYAVYLLQA